MLLGGRDIKLEALMLCKGSFSWFIIWYMYYEFGTCWIVGITTCSFFFKGGLIVWVFRGQIGISFCCSFGWVPKICFRVSSTECWNLHLSPWRHFFIIFEIKTYINWVSLYTTWYRWTWTIFTKKNAGGFWVPEGKHFTFFASSSVFIFTFFLLIHNFFSSLFCSFCLLFRFIWLIFFFLFIVFLPYWLFYFSNFIQFQYCSLILLILILSL